MSDAEREVVHHGVGVGELDDHLDAEYTFYGLLALGHLSL